MAKDIKRIFPQYILGEEKIFDAAGHNISVKSFGVTSLLFDDGKTRILFDGMVSRPPLWQAFMGTFDSNVDLVENLVKENHMEKLDAVFVSHSHYDHVLDVPTFARLSSADVYGSRSTLNVVLGNGVPAAQLHKISVGDTYEVGDFSVKVLKALHSTAHFYNDDLGVEIEEPVTYPTTMKQLSEGGSFDFYITHGEKSFLIHPSCNFVPHSFDEMRADVVFLSVGTLGGLKAEMKARYYDETIGKLKPKLVMPIHWDYFFYPLEKADYTFYVLDKAIEGIAYLAERLEEDGITFEILLATKAKSFHNKEERQRA